MPRNGTLAADRASAAPAGIGVTELGSAITGIGHAADIGSSQSKPAMSKGGASRVAARRPATRDRDPPPEAGFEGGERRRRRTAQRRLDGRERPQTPIRRRIGAGFAPPAGAAPRRPASPRFCVCLGASSIASDSERNRRGRTISRWPRRVQPRTCGWAGSPASAAASGPPYPLALARRIERGKIDDNPAAELTQPQLRARSPRPPRGWRGGPSARRPGFRAAGIDVDQHRRASLVDMDRPAVGQRHARRERAVEQPLQLERPFADPHMSDVAVRKSPAQFGQRCDFIDQDPVGRRRQPQLQRGGETGRRIKPRRRLEQGGVGDEPIGSPAMRAPTTTPPCRAASRA